MVKRFIFWLEGIVEDDPLFDEIKVVIFWVCQNGSYKYLEMRGQERLDVNAPFFRPLEAEFYSLREISTANDKLFVSRLKSLIDEAFSSDVLKQQFNKRKIYLYYNKLELLFEI